MKQMTRVEPATQPRKTFGLNIYELILYVPPYTIKKVDVPQVLISTAAIFGIGLIWYDFNVKVFNTVRDLLNTTLSEETN